MYLRDLIPNIFSTHFEVLDHMSTLSFDGEGNLKLEPTADKPLDLISIIFNSFLQFDKLLFFFQ